MNDLIFGCIGHRSDAIITEGGQDLPDIFHGAVNYFAIVMIGLPAGLLSMVLHTILESHLRYKELTAVVIISDFLRIILIILHGFCMADHRCVYSPVCRQLDQNWILLSSDNQKG